MRDVNIHEVYQHRLLYLLHHEDTSQAKLARCRAWLDELPQYPSLGAAIYPTFAACHDVLKALVAACLRRGSFVYRTTSLTLSDDYQRRVAARLAARKARQ